MGCGASNAAVVGATPREGTSNVLLLGPAEWLAGVRLLPAAHEAVMKWCDEQGVGEMGDVKHIDEVDVLRSLPKVQQAKLRNFGGGRGAKPHKTVGLLRVSSDKAFTMSQGRKYTGQC